MWQHLSIDNSRLKGSAMGKYAEQLTTPLKFAPVYQSVVWGGRKMEQWRSDLPEGPIGESWEISQQARGMSVVATGSLRGVGLDELMAEDSEALVGYETDELRC